MIEVRALKEVEEFRDAVALQRTIWGFEEHELLPVRLFVVATKVGGQAFGAFDGERMVGFCLAIPGLKPGGKPYLHSHMLGVLPEYNNRGIGRLLKLEQRRDALSRGLDLVEWTFDPLELKNAYFNIERLGAVVRRYVLNQYGITTSPLHGSLPTDRCVAEWWIASDRVRKILERQPVVRPSPAARIPVPSEIAMLRKQDPARAREIQKRVSDAFLEHFGRGLAVYGFERSDAAGEYLLAPWPFD
ncbi:MAG: GNAT family N-acetyltransferase [Bryobacterales bacterium]|nr:GNAT family N-acetyltransferase [Bryobacteraceae bacterium]MDW8355658.1 GNAT family N-acetyltransferase [Bryobacterales bacterium]